jgi:hypothetical protein
MPPTKAPTPNPPTANTVRSPAGSYPPPPAGDRQRGDGRDWYSVSVESMRRAVVLLVSVVVLIGSALIYQQWQYLAQKGQAEQVISQAAALTHQIEERPDADQLRREFFGAWEDLENARRALTESQYGQALSLGTRSLLELQQILQSDDQDGESRGRFLDVQGQVEFRRGDLGSWKRARDQDHLNPGDWVKTSANGSAKLLFPNGVEYTLRSNTMLHVTFQLDRFGNSEPAAEMPFGALDLATAQGSSRVKTPRAEAAVRRSSEAMVSFDRETNAARFAAYTGNVEVVAANGQTQTVAALQQLEQIGDVLSAPTTLPDRPRPLFPTADREIDLDGGEMRLTWSRVATAGSYALNISENRLFVSNLIERASLIEPTARIGLRGEGTFYWQVAAIDPGGVRGPWSETRVFRVLRRQGNVRDDKAPPPLDLESVQSYGSLLIVSGRTEAGARLTINGEAATVGPDGRFSKTLRMTQEGFVFVEVVATDERGNAAREQRRVFFDAAS